VAEVARTSRPALTRLIKTKATPSRAMRKKLQEAFEVLAAAKARDNDARERLRERVRMVGPKQLASELGVDRANLSAMLAGRRPFNGTVKTKEVTSLDVEAATEQ
jgi:transcriptional regulator with XRE-family HTH domain